MVSFILNSSVVNAAIHLVLDGSCVIEDADVRIAMQTGDFLLFPTGGARRILNTAGTGPHPGQTSPAIPNDCGMLPMRRNGTASGVDYQSEAAFGRAFRAHAR